MDFDILIPTRNRIEILKISLPLIILQSRLPRRIVAVDASDHHLEVRLLFEKELLDRPIDLHFIESEPGITHQRNLGLYSVESQVVFIMDDDSLWFPNYAESVMKIYERDEMGQIGSVCGTEVNDLPQTVSRSGLPYEMRWQDRFSSKTSLVKSILLMSYRDPILLECERKLRQWKGPSWLEEENAEPSIDFSGCKASFRSSLVKELGYDETLRRYSLFEDRELLLRLLDTHIPVRSKNAKVIHYRSPGNRTTGKEWGVIDILNRTYIVCKHSPPGSLSRQRLKWYFFFSLPKVIGQMTSQFGRQRFIGTIGAMIFMNQLMKAEQKDLPKVYILLRKKLLGVESEIG